MCILKYPRKEPKFPPIVSKYKRVTSSIQKYKRSVKQITKFKRDKWYPSEEDITTMLGWVYFSASRQSNKLANGEYFSSVDNFYGEGQLAVASVISRYKGFRAKSEFEKLCKASCSNKFKDIFRKIFRKKRAGVLVQLPQDGDDPDTSQFSWACADHVVSSTGESDVPGLSDKSSQLNEYRTLVEFLKEYSQDSSETLQLVIHNLLLDPGWGSNKKIRNKYSSEFEEIQKIAEYYLHTPTN